MVACARRDVVCDDEVSVYHCWARCVRRAFLFGADPHSGNDFNHRRDWIHQLYEQAAELFGVEVGFHTELSNHVHLVLRIRPDVVENWSDEEVARRWLKIAKLKRGSDISGWEPSDARLRLELADSKRVEKLRGRLSSISWFMGTICENIGRRANRQDDCTGRFWETRFRLRRLADETAILVCGIYVDLNQIRAGEALTPEESRHTSAFDRIEARKTEDVGSRQMQHPTPEPAPRPDRWLCELTLQEGADSDVAAGLLSATPWRASDKGLLPISLENYLELLDWTGRQVRADKQGAIPAHLASILDRLHIRVDHWLETITEFDVRFGHVVGRAAQMAKAAQRMGRHWLCGSAAAARAFT